jgi:hypothetical protein
MTNNPLPAALASIKRYDIDVYGNAHEREGGAWMAAVDVIATLPTPAVDGRTLCGWTEDADGIWESDCGESWQFTDGGPHENNCAFCHKCGKSLDIVAYVEEKETEE